MNLRQASRVFLVGTTIETLSVVVFATAARTESIQPEVPTTTRTSQTFVNSANQPAEGLPISQGAELQQDAQPLPDASDTLAVNTDTTDTEVLPNQGDSGNSEAARETVPATVSDSPATTTNIKTTLQESQILQIDPPNSAFEGEQEGITNAPVSTQVKILTPTPNTVLDVPAATVTIQFSIGSQVELRVNGATVDSSLIGRTETDDTNKLVTQTWYGVGLQQGENTITAQATTNGSAGQLASVKVQVRGDVKQLKIQTVEARIPADGRSTATVQGQLLDAEGNRSNQDAVVTLAASAGTFVGEDAKPDQLGFQVQARQGQFTATLRSDLNAQTVRILAKAKDLEAFTQIQSGLTQEILELRDVSVAQ